MNIELTQRQVKFVKELLDKEFDKQEGRYRKIQQAMQVQFEKNGDEEQDKCIESLSMLTPIICQLS